MNTWQPPTGTDENPNDQSTGTDTHVGIWARQIGLKALSSGNMLGAHQRTILGLGLGLGLGLHRTRHTAW